MRAPHDDGKIAEIGPVPDDVRRAVAFLRASLRRPASMDDLVRHCGTAERTLTAHFRRFVGLPPMAYLRRVRLAAAREALFAGGAEISVTEVAGRYLFDHAGRFAQAYRAQFGEPPSATMRRARAAARSAKAGEFAGKHSEQGRDGDGPRRYRMPIAREKPSVAVLLGAAASGDPGLRGLAEAVAEAVAADLSSIRALSVVLPPAGAGSRDPRRVTRETGARYLLTGRIARQDASVRFVLRLADAATGQHFWGDSVDGDFGRPLVLQDRIVQSVRGGVVPGIRGDAIDRASRAAPRDLDGNGLAMRALPLLYASTPDGARRALDGLGRAIEIDPDDGLAAALAAWAHGQTVMYNATADPASDRDRAAQLLRRAAALDTDDPLALTARCAVHMTFGELDVADALAARALALDPTSGWAWGRSGWLHAYRGDSATAIAHFRQALKVEAGAARANVFAGIGSAHFHAGRYAAAARWIREAMRLQPGLAWANRSLSVSYARLGEPQRAREALDALRRFQPGLTVGRVVDAVPFRPDFLDRLGDGLTSLGLPP